MSAQFRPNLGSSAGLLILGLTGGREDDWIRLRRVYRMIGLSSRVLFFAALLAGPVVIQEMLRKWASGAIAAQRLARR